MAIESLPEHEREVLALVRYDTGYAVNEYYDIIFYDREKSTWVFDEDAGDSYYKEHHTILKWRYVEDCFIDVPAPAEK